MMSMMVSFCAVLFPQDVLDEILDLIESVLEGFPTYSFIDHTQCTLYCEYLLLPLQCYGGPIVFILILKFPRLHSVRNIDIVLLSMVLLDMLLNTNVLNNISYFIWSVRQNIYFDCCCT